MVEVSSVLFHSHTDLVLARYLPLRVGDLVPEGDEYWGNFLQMSLIMDYLFRASYNRGMHH